MSSSRVQRLQQQLAEAAEKDGVAAERHNRKIREAMALALDSYLDGATTEAAAKLFSDLEKAATAAQKKLIVQHSKRPQITDKLNERRLLTANSVEKPADK